MTFVDEVGEPWAVPFTIAVGEPALWLTELVGEPALGLTEPVERWLCTVALAEFVLSLRLDWWRWLEMRVWPLDTWVVEALPCRRTPRFVTPPEAE